MNIESLRKYCLSFPGATENVQWDNDLLFRVGGKIFAVMPLEEAALRVSFKCSPEEFAELIEIDGIKPAAYLARYHWVTVERTAALGDSELKRLIRDSYEMILAKLPKAERAKLATAAKQKSPAGGKRK
jgi:predicted DNA-binding protein (MmcQ/YjbR family)